MNDLPPEVTLKICKYLPHHSLAQLCATSKSLHDFTLPLLYITIIPGSTTGCLHLFRQLAHNPSVGYIGLYAPLVQSIQIPKTAASRRVMEAIALALSRCVGNGYLPALRHLKWPFTVVCRGIMEDIYACKFDEPLWKAMLETYDEFDTLVLRNASHVPDDSDLWDFKAKCKNFDAPRPSVRHHT